jgi:hypothetical protein
MFEEALNVFQKSMQGKLTGIPSMAMKNNQAKKIMSSKPSNIYGVRKPKDTTKMTSGVRGLASLSPKMAKLGVGFNTSTGKSV